MITVPNALTLLRIGLTPVFGYLWWRGLHGWALTVFAVASLSDWLDGFFARLLDQRSRIGQILDPAADKLLVLVCFVVAAAVHAVPRWLAALVIGRDVVLASGGALFAFVLRSKYPPRRWQPTRIGKYSTFTQVLTIFFALGHDLTRSPWLLPYVQCFTILCAALTLLSGVQYVAFGFAAVMTGRAPERGDPRLS